MKIEYSCYKDIVHTQDIVIMALPLLLEDIDKDTTPFESNLSCLNSILQMLRSIPEINEMFTNETFRADGAVTEICDEIHRIFAFGGVASASDLRAILGFHASNSFNAKMLFAKHQNLEVVFFREVLEVIRSELQMSDKKVIQTWDKFFGGELNFLEIDKNQVSVEEFLNKKCKTLLPDFLVIRTSCESSPSYTFTFCYPESRVTLENGDTYTLTCIVDKDRLTGKYSSAVVVDGAWVRQKGMKLECCSKDEVKTMKNYLYLYVKEHDDKRFKIGGAKFPLKKEYYCTVPGCPEDLGFVDEESLEDHYCKEHKTCPNCKEQFLLNYLYVDHISYCQVPIVKKERKRRFTKDSDSGLESLRDHEEDAPFMKDEELIKVEAKKPKTEWKIRFNKDSDSCLGGLRDHEEDAPFIKDEEPIKVEAKKPKTELCQNDDCGMIGPHWCLYPKIEEENGRLTACGEIHCERSIIGGVPYFTPFVNSFMKNTGTTFLFQYQGDQSIKIQSANLDGKLFDYELGLFGNGYSSRIKGNVGEMRKVAIFNMVTNSKISFKVSLGVVNPEAIK